MTEPAFLAYLSDPFSVRDAAYWLILPNGETYRASAQDVSIYNGPLVTYDLPALIDELGRGQCGPPKLLIDVGEALRLLTGTPRNEGGERRWDVWCRLTPLFPIGADAKCYE